MERGKVEGGKEKEGEEGGRVRERVQREKQIEGGGARGRKEIGVEGKEGEREGGREKRNGVERGRKGEAVPFALGL